jgi:hypothetical protein
VTLTFTPSRTVSGGATVQVRFSETWKVNPLATSSCLVNAAATISQLCTLNGQVAVIKLPAGVTFQSQQSQTLKIVSKVMTPETLEQALIDIETYDVDGTTLLEVSSGYVTLQPKQLDSGTTSLLLVGNEVR